MRANENTAFCWTHNGKEYAIRVRQDPYPQSPREWDNLCTMACWHRRYSLGDSAVTYRKDIDDFWHDEVRSRVNVEDIISAAEEGKLDGIRVVKRNGLIDVYETIQLRTVLGNSEPEEVLEYEGIMEGALPDYLVDDLTVGHCMTLLEPHIAVLPLWLYDHSGITISCGDRVYPYNDRWDSGQVGWIFISKDRVMKEVGTEYVLDENGERIKEEHVHPDAQTTWSFKTRPLTEETWRARAEEIMKEEVKVYDQYLRGEVFGYELFEKDEDGDWTGTDCCYGFYGDDILESGLADNVGYDFREAVENNSVIEGTADEVHSVSVVFDF